MKRFALFIFLLLIAQAATAITPQDSIHKDCRYDSLRIKAYDHPFATDEDITRYAFLMSERFNNGNDKITGNIIKDTVIVEKTVVDEFVRLLKQLPVSGRTKYPSNWIVFDMQCDEGGTISLTSRSDYGDNRMLVILYSTNHQDFAWFDSANIYFLDKHCYYSDEIRKLIVKWVKCIHL